MWDFFTSGVFLVPVAVILIVIAFFAMMKLATSCYVRVPPNKAVIFFGRKHKTSDGKEVGFRIITSGAKLRIPLLEDTRELDLNVFPIDLSVRGAPNRDGVLVNVKAVANVKILGDEASLNAAAERFIGMNQGQIKDIAFKNLEGHLRGIVGRLTVEEIVGDRAKFNQEVLKEASEDLKKIGLGVDVLTIQEIEDEGGYIKALGQKRTAEVMRDASVGKAEAERDAKQRSTTANMAGETKANENLALVAQAVRDKEVKEATFRAETETAKAKAAQAGPLADAEARKAVVTAEVEVERAKTEREVEVAVAEAERREKQLIAEIIKPAEASKAAAIASAEGQAQSIKIQAQAAKDKKQLEGEGEAAAIRAKGQAEADVIKFKLLAEAEGVHKKAEAYKQLDEKGKFLLILQTVKEVLPEVVEKFAKVIEAAASPIASVDKINIVDFGGGNGSNGAGALAKITQVGPELIKQFFAACKESGLDISGLQNLLQIKDEPEAETKKADAA